MNYLSLPINDSRSLWRSIWLIDCVIDCCLMSSEKYLGFIQDNNFTYNKWCKWIDDNRMGQKRKRLIALNSIVQMRGNFILVIKYHNVVVKSRTTIFTFIGVIFFIVLICLYF